MTMRLQRFTGVVIALFFFVSFLGATEKTITILHVNDTHSHLDAFGPKDLCLNGTIGGIAKAASVIGTVRASSANLLLLHAGDVFHGDLFFNKYFGVPELQMMRQMGFDAMAIGNHEFDFGPDVFAGSLANAFGTPANGFPILAANVTIPDGNLLGGWVKSGVIIERGGIKFGVFGMTVPNDPTTRPAPLQIHAEPELFQDAVNAIGSLQKQGAQIIICLSHLGVLYDQALAANVPGIDFILGGHDQIVLEQPIVITNPLGRPTPIFQAGEFYKYVGKLTLTVKLRNGTIASVDYTYRLLPVDRWTLREPGIQAVVETLKKGIEQQYGDVYHKVIGITLKDLSRSFDAASPLRDTPLGNLVTDACRKMSGTDISIAAFGLISEKIYAGAITGADVFRAMSYGFDETTGLGFKLVKVQMTGADLVNGLETSLSFLGVSDDFFLQLSGMKYKYDARKAVGSRVILESVQVNDKPVDPAAVYTVTVNEGIAALLPKMNVNATVLEVMPDFEYTVVRDYVKHLGIVSYRPEGRILDVSVKSAHGQSWNDGVEMFNKPSTDSPSEMVTEFRLSQNYPNPFNPSTTIGFSLPADRHVTLKIYSLIGQEVATLTDEEMTAGRHALTWNAGSVATGLYFYRLVAGDFTATKKLSIVK